MRVVILHDRVTEDSRPDEVDVLVEARVVAEALSSLGYDPVTLPFSLDLPGVAESLRAAAPGFVFNLVESVEGQGRLIYLAPALLDTLGIAYTGAPTEGMFCTSNKVLAKRIMWRNGIPTPAWVEATGGRGSEAEPKGRYIVKSVWEDGSVGLDDDSIFEPGSGRELGERLERDRRRLGECFAEAYIEGREIDLALLGGPGGAEVIGAAEIEFLGYAEGKPRVVGYPAKWEEESYEYHNTPRRLDFPPEDRGLLGRLKAIALGCWWLFGLRGYARVDFRVDAGGEPWVLEVNANPCLSPDAGFAAALEWAGIPFVGGIERIINDSIVF